MRDLSSIPSPATHPAWCSAVACSTAGSITEHRSTPSAVATPLDTDRRVSVSVTADDEAMAGELHVGEPGVQLRLHCPDEPAQRGGDIVLDPRAAFALAKALTDAATVVLGEHQGGDR